jgi:hypothetical protein
MRAADLFFRRPLDSVGEERLKRRQIVHAAIVANRETVIKF